MQEPQLRKADLWTGLFWIVFGGSILAHSTTMPIPAHLGATVLSGPGLVPGLLGAALCLLGAVLAIRSVRGAIVVGPDAEVAPGSVSNLRALLALVMMVVYAAALATRQPFVPVTIAFVTLFVTAFNWSGSTNAGRVRLVAGALVLGAATAFAVEFVFESFFFVRLP